MTLYRMKQKYDQYSKNSKYDVRQNKYPTIFVMKTYTCFYILVNQNKAL